MAKFRIKLGGKFLSIRYLAVRNAKGFYRGALDASQEESEIRKLEGQQQLLDWVMGSGVYIFRFDP
jgi:hypothetical protein